MKKFIFILFCITFLASTSNAQEPRTPEQLVKQYTNYFEKAEVDKLMSLYWQEGAPKFIVDFTKDDLQEDAENHIIVSAIIQDVSKEEKEKWIKGKPYKGKTLIPNLEPSKVMEVQYEGEENKDLFSGVMIGRVGKTHYFILTKFKEE